MNESQIRAARESDAAAFLDLWGALDTETEFMLFEPNERKTTLKEQKLRLAASEQSNTQHVLVLEDPSERLANRA